MIWTPSKNGWSNPDYADAGAITPMSRLSIRVRLFGTYAGQARDLAPCLRVVEINRDRNLRLQYLRDSARNWYQVKASLANVVYRKFPENSLPAGTSRAILKLKIALANVPSK